MFFSYLCSRTGYRVHVPNEPPSYSTGAQTPQERSRPGGARLTELLCFCEPRCGRGGYVCGDRSPQRHRASQQRERFADV